MPVRLPAVAHTLDVVREESAFSEGMITFVGGKIRVIFIQRSKNLESRSEGRWVLLLKNGLCLAGNCGSVSKEGQSYQGGGLFPRKR